MPKTMRVSSPAAASHSTGPVVGRNPISSATAATIPIEERMGEIMAEVRAIAGQFPRLRASLDSPAAEYGAAPEGSFRFGLEATLDGLEVRRIRADGRARSPA